MIATQPAMVRVGMPQSGGTLWRIARDAGFPLLVSANAFARYDKDGRFCGFALSSAARVAAGDVALDSAGFVAMARYRRYPWSVAAYIELAASGPWAWWAAMDYCTERELAGNRLERRLRIAATCHGFADCVRYAGDRGITAPLPVLQGQLVDDYRHCAEMLPLLEWPVLVGVGSMCRREVSGANGVVAVVDLLDRVLPAHVRLHLFGVKSEALAALNGHPRLASVDSCAWDADARRRWPTGRTQAKRGTAMREWVERQGRRCAVPAAMQMGLDGLQLVDSEVDEADEAVISEWADLVAGGEVDYESARWHAARELVYGRIPDIEFE